MIARWLVLGPFNVFSSQSVRVPTQRRLSHELASPEFKSKSKSVFPSAQVSLLLRGLVYMLVGSSVAVGQTLLFWHSTLFPL